MMANHHEHHYRNLARARDHLTETMQSLRSAIDQMTGDEWLEAVDVLRMIEHDVAPRLGGLRTRASDRFDEHTRDLAFPLMLAGTINFPDERAPEEQFPNARIGAQLVAHHGSVDAAMMAYQPDSSEFDHIQAHRYVTTGKRPRGWIPPIAGSS